MKKQLLDLLEEIQKRTGMNQAEISIKAGYGPGYISEALSKDRVTQKLINKIRLVYDQESAFIKNAANQMMEIMIMTLATSRVALRILSEQQAPAMKLPATEVANIYQRLVRDEAEAVRGEVKVGS